MSYIGPQSTRATTNDLRSVASTTPLVLEDIYKTYGAQRVLTGINLALVRGEILALVGANGAGKTTLTSIAAGLLQPDSGRVFVDGVDMRSRRDEAQMRIGLAPQDVGVYPTLQVHDNLRFFGELVGLRRGPLREQIARAADAMALTHLLQRRASTLSGGETRRLHTAMALLGQPPLLLLDEPTAGVDIHTRTRLLEVVRALATEGSAVCYVTHSMADVEQLDASVAILHRERLVARSSVKALVTSHNTSTIEMHFDGIAPILPGMANVHRSETTLRVVTTKAPSTELAAILGQLGDTARRLRDVRIVQPSLESVFLSMTSGDAAQSGVPSYTGIPHPCAAQH